MEVVGKEAKSAGTDAVARRLARMTLHLSSQACEDNIDGVQRASAPGGIRVFKRKAVTAGTHPACSHTNPSHIPHLATQQRLHSSLVQMSSSEEDEDLSAWASDKEEDAPSGPAAREHSLPSEVAWLDSPSSRRPQPAAPSALFQQDCTAHAKV